MTGPVVLIYISFCAGMIELRFKLSGIIVAALVCPLFNCQFCQFAGTNYNCQSNFFQYTIYSKNLPHPSYNPIGHMALYKIDYNWFGF